MSLSPLAHMSSAVQDLPEPDCCMRNELFRNQDHSALTHVFPGFNPAILNPDIRYGPTPSGVSYPNPCPQHSTSSSQDDESHQVIVPDRVEVTWQTVPSPVIFSSIANATLFERKVEVLPNLTYRRAQGTSRMARDFTSESSSVVSESLRESVKKKSPSPEFVAIPVKSGSPDSVSPSKKEEVIEDSTFIRLDELRTSVSSAGASSSSGVTGSLPSTATGSLSSTTGSLVLKQLMTKEKASQLLFLAKERASLILQIDFNIREIRNNINSSMKELRKLCTCGGSRYQQMVSTSQTCNEERAVIAVSDIEDQLNRLREGVEEQKNIVREMREDCEWRNQ